MRRVGDLVSFICDFDYHPYTTVQRGELGTVVWIDVLTGSFEFELHAYHVGLRAWFNCLLVVPGECDDLEPCLAFKRAPSVPLRSNATHETLVTV